MTGVQTCALPISCILDYRLLADDVNEDSSLRIVPCHYERKDFRLYSTEVRNHKSDKINGKLIV